MARKGSKGSTKTPIDPHTLEIIHEYILGVANDSSDLREPHLRPSLTETYELVIFAFSLLIVVGFVSNLIVFYAIIRRKMYRDTTQAFVLNNAICDIVKCLFVLPLSAYVLLVQNWVLGELMCTFLPMIQDIPMHVSTLTFTLMAWDRQRFIRNPHQTRFPAFVCCFGTWLTSMCLVLPYPLYIMYVDIGNYVEELIGVGICIYNLVDDMEEYMRGIFLTMYVAPMILVSYMYVRTSQKLRNRMKTSAKGVRMSAEGYINGHRLLQRDTKFADGSINSRSTSENYQGNEEDVEHIPRRVPKLNVLQEKRNQGYLVFTVSVYGICMCPIMVLRLVRFYLVETYDSSGIIDVVYTVFVWIAFAPVCITPLVHIVWQFSCLYDTPRCLKGAEIKHSGDTVDILDSALSASFQRRLYSDDQQPLSTGSSSLIDGSSGSCRES
ncbi:alpha-1B adrenergic receptor [Coccinella septempunctata]|uniref:alpha-1B adrenergic receptor n=1 Tax=Coccinella septempunctata TaxID=41139 RepID=UPI001D08D4A1|nr:alpha-1B adrenergic receptor [Coccinella septempunctata]